MTKSLATFFSILSQVVYLNCSLKYTTKPTILKLTLYGQRKHFADLKCNQKLSEFFTSNVKCYSIAKYLKTYFWSQTLDFLWKNTK